jgi:hypothetical protein
MVAIDVLDLESMMVESANKSIRQVVIPRNTFFTVGGIHYSLEYPISIRKPKLADFQVVYHDDDKPSPLTPLSGNNIEYEIITAKNGLDYLRFTVPTLQFQIETRIDTVSFSSGRHYSFEFEDQFCLARVYIQTPPGIWKEIQTTHNLQVYDPNVETVCITVEGKVIRFETPLVYVQNETIKGKIRYDVYSTKGRLTTDLGRYSPEHFGATWNAIDTADITEEVKVLKEIKNIFIRSNTLVNGGRDTLSFKELRDRVMKNATGRQTLPITNAQAQVALLDKSYEIHTDIDTLTNRVFKACKSPPAPIDKTLITPASVSMSTVKIALEYSAGSVGVFDNGDSFTLSPSTLYRNKNGIVEIVSRQEYDELFASTPAKRSKLVTERSYHYSPFYYVLDATTSTFEVRPYHLSTPKIITKSFIAENYTAGVQSSISHAYGVFLYEEFNADGSLKDQGYLIELKTKSNSEFRKLEDNQIGIQLSFQPTNKVNPVFLMGTWVETDILTRERTFQFRLSTKFDISIDDELSFISFADKETAAKTKANLKQKFNVFIMVFKRDNPGAVIDEGYTPSIMDDRIGKFQLEEGIKALVIAQETLEIEFGKSLKNLWCQSRSNVAEVKYETYQADVQALYEEDVYSCDSATGYKFNFDSNGKIIPGLLHKKGDPVLDNDGLPVYQYRKNDVVYKNGTPSPTPGYKRYLTRFVDILTIEGAYYFATDSVTAEYKKLIRDTFVTWITSELAEFEEHLLEQTKIYFNPKSNAGNVRVLTPGNLEATIESAQSLKVKLHVPPTTYNDYQLRDALIRSTISVIDEMFKSKIVSVSDIEQALKEKYRSDVLNIELEGVTGQSGYAMVTVLDEANRLGIKKKLVTLADGVLTVEEDISVQFIEHGFVV